MHSAARKYGGGRTPGSEGRLQVRAQTPVYARKMLQPISPQLLAQNVLPKAVLRSDRDPHGVTTAVEYVGKHVVVNKVTGHTDTEIRSGFPGYAAAKAAKNYGVRLRRLSAQQAAD
jgi:hypothetical protein